MRRNSFKKSFNRCDNRSWKVLAGHKSVKKNYSLKILMILHGFKILLIAHWIGSKKRNKPFLWFISKEKKIGKNVGSFLDSASFLKIGKILPEVYSDYCLRVMCNNVIQRALKLHITRPLQSNWVIER